MSMAVLVVDDAQDWSKMLAGLINDIYAHVKVVTAGSLEEAQHHLLRHAFDLAIIDIRLDERDEGNTDGLTLMEHIRAHHNSVQTIIITGYASLAVVEEVMRPDAAGMRPAVDFIEKSKISRELLPRIATILAGEAEGQAP